MTLQIHTRLQPPKKSQVYLTYWQFAAERQAIFMRRMRAEPFPWTQDEVLAKYKFTNAYRASDRVSQYLIRNVIYRNDLPNTPREIVFRTLLFKLFNKIETWKLLEREFHPITFRDYRFSLYRSVLETAMRNGVRIYSAAYIMPSGRRYTGKFSKFQNHLKLLERMINDELPKKITEVASMKKGYELFTSYPSIGSFLGYQFVTDINYSSITNFSEMEFVMPGPGARNGLRKCFVEFGGYDETSLIELVCDMQEQEFQRLGLDFQNLFGRPLQLIDCQNLFCEVDKYARKAHPEYSGLTSRKRIKQKFRPSLTPIKLFYPPKWDLNEKVKCLVNSESNNLLNLGIV